MQGRESSDQPDGGPRPTGDDETAATFVPRSRRARRTTANLPRGTTLNRYVILERLGGGGMGVIYTAYDPELHRRIAIKLLHVRSSRGRDAQARTRLLREAQALAQLSHPNVVAAYDVGTFEGDVFVAMELVEGVTLKQWSADRRRSLREILAVFVAAGRGLAAAHAAGLIHRDFKPDNLMVGRDGRVRVVDFGLARTAGPSEESSRLASSGTGSSPDDLTLSTGDSEPDTASSISAEATDALLGTQLTRVGMVLGTPAYMSPEQHLADEIAPQTDQFSFCVALYEALYGEHPFGRESRDEVKRRVLAGEVSAPPRDVRVPRWVHRTLLRGLQVRPEDRYPSMDALVAELSRDPGARRRRVLTGLAVAALVGASALAGVGGAAEESQRCRGNERLLSGVWDDAVKQTVRAAFVATGRPNAAETFARVERALDDYAAGWRAMRAEACEATYQRGDQSETLFDRQVSCLSERLGELDALTTVLAEAQDGAVLDRSVTAALALQELDGCADRDALLAVYPPPPSAVRERVEQLRGSLDRGDALIGAGRYEDALALARDAVAEAETLDYPPATARAYRIEGLALDYAGEWKQAEASLHAAMRAGAAARDDWLVARAMLDLVWNVGYHQSRASDALALEPLIAASIIRAGDGADLRARLFNHIGIVLDITGKHEQSLARFRRAVALYETAYGPDAVQVAGPTKNVGKALHALGRYEEARAVQERAIALEVKVLGPDHPLVGDSFYNLGGHLLALGRFDEARRAYQRTFEIAHALGPRHPHVGGALSRLAHVDEATGDYAAAQRQAEQALAIFQELLGRDHPMNFDPLMTLARVRRELGDYEQARRHLERAAVLYEVIDAEHPNFASALASLGVTLEAQGDAAGAAQHLERALAMLEAAVGPEHPELADVLVSLSSAMRALGRHADAQHHDERALALAEGALGPEHPMTGQARLSLGLTHIGRGEHVRAHDELRRALANLEAAFGEEHPRVADALTALGECELAVGNPAGALPLLQRALAIRERRESAPPVLGRTRSALARARRAGAR